jgi:cardiolipin synthase C
MNARLLTNFARFVSGCCAGFLAVAVLALGGCSSLPLVDRSAIASQAVPSDARTALARIAPVGQPTPESSGFRLLPLGTFALDARVQLTKRAQATLDVQYFHFANDDTGRWLLRQLRDAAARGVRVRLLIDDVYTAGADDVFLGFAAHPNVEVRLFNPFIRARGSGPVGRFLAAPFDWGRINHRMHNKMFIADGAWAVIGGRNIADEYFLRKESNNFIDVDALVVGQVLPPLQALFDRYWNSDIVYPLQAIARTEQTIEERLASFEDAISVTPEPRPVPFLDRDVLGYGPIGPDLDAGALQLIWASAYVFADHPDKPFDGAVGGELLETSVTYNVFEAISMAKQEVVISSPYFVPGKHGTKLFTALRNRNVRVSVLTNSLASTDEPIVHLGYSRYRTPLLKMGVELYELSHKRVKENMQMLLMSKTLGRLHSKTVVIDKRVSYLGSMNLSPRSATINTEFGAVVDSLQLAKELCHLIEIDRLHSAYRVQMRPDGGLEWVAPDSNGKIIVIVEPDSGWWSRWLGKFLEPFTPEDNL